MLIGSERRTMFVAGLKSKFVGASGDQVTVEQLALEYYATPEGGGWQGARRQALLRICCSMQMCHTFSLACTQ